MAHPNSKVSRYWIATTQCDDDTDALQQVGWKLAQFTENLRIEFEYKYFVANSLADLNSSMFDIRPGETVVVDFVYELHQLLAIPGAGDKLEQLGNILYSGWNLNGRLNVEEEFEMVII
ncbi:Della protein gai [Thalictrum thalictroides]|uniref:Della protein gai n=1 Tax=Thalictrum thalictroides TaxID=46969 RepID=A0A7J6V327_THATH|nr:Della protein gai [Thalictrum thalictroides]